MSKAKRTTMSKMNRERELKEKRARKQERKEPKKLAAAAASAPRAEAPTATPPGLAPQPKGRSRRPPYLRLARLEFFSLGWVLG